MSNTPSDELRLLLQEARSALWQPANVELCERIDDALARWGTPQPVVREPLTADDLRMPKDGQQWRVEWWNESCRMLLPANKKLDGFQAYKTGTLMFTIKERGITQKGGSNAE